MPRLITAHDIEEQQPGILTPIREAQQQIAFQASLLEQVTNGIVAVDNRFQVTYWNRAAERLFGFTSAEAVGQRYDQVVTGVDLATANRRLVPYIQKNGAWKGEVICRTRWNTDLTVELTCSLIRNDANEVTGIVAIHRDVTERRRTEAKLHAAQDRLRLAQEALSIGTWEYDIESRVAHCSDRLLRLYGLTDRRTDLTDEELLRCLPNEDRLRLLDQALSNPAELHALDRQYRVVWPDGSVHWLHSKTSVLLDRHGSPQRIVGADFDVTDHMEKENRLRILSSAVEQSPVSIVITDLAGHIEYANPKTSEVTGYSLDELRGQTPRMLKAGELPAEEHARLWNTIQHGEWRGVFHNRRKNGQLFWEAATIRPIRDKNGFTTHYLAVNEDITERRRLEEALRHSEQRFRIAAEHANDLLYEMDPETGIVTTFGAAPEWLPKPRGARGHPLGAWMSLVHQDDRERVQQAITWTLNGGGSFRQEYRLITGDGVRWWSDHGTVLRDNAGKPVKWIGAGSDITERKEAEAALKRSEERFRLIAETIEEVFWIAPPDQSSLHYISPAYERVWGRSIESAYRQPRDFINAIHPDDLNAALASLALTNTGQPFEHEYRIITPDGRVKWIWNRAFPVTEASGLANCYVGVARDITERKHMEHHLVQAQKLESIGQLAAGIAHEINTPIQYIGDNAMFLEESFRDFLRYLQAQRQMPATANSQCAHIALDGGRVPDEADLEYLQQEIPKAISQLLEGVDRVAKIVRAMKEFSHPGPAEMIPVDINRAIASTALVCRNEWKYVAELTMDFAPDLPPVPCVASELNQVILNLIVNAAQAIDGCREAEQKGDISISTRRNGSCVEIRVSDTGGGIPREIQSKVFDPFFTTKEVGKGTGQGLAIAHAVIVQKHGGSIRFETEEQIGTSFIIELPLTSRLEQNETYPLCG